VAAAASNGAPRTRAFFAIAGWVAAATAGFLLAWLVFYYVGAALARAPFDFHTG